MAQQLTNLRQRHTVLITYLRIRTAQVVRCQLRPSNQTAVLSHNLKQTNIRQRFPNLVALATARKILPLPHYSQKT